MEEIKELVEKTDNFSFGQLREFIVGAFCLNKPVDEVINRIRNHLDEGLDGISNNTRQLIEQAMRINE